MILIYGFHFLLHGFFPIFFMFTFYGFFIGFGFFFYFF